MIAVSAHPGTTRFDVVTALDTLKSSEEWVRAWTIQLGFESEEILARLLREAGEKGLKAEKDLTQLAESDPSPVVRRFIASGIQRSSNDKLRADVLERLVQHGEDAADHNLPLMYWFAAEPLVASDADFAETLLKATKIPKLRPLIARRLAAAAQAAEK